MALALTARRRAAAAGASVLAAVALAIAVVGRGCHVSEPGPDAAVRRMIAAANDGDRRAVFAMLTPATQKALEERAQRATELVGSNIRYTALDLIAIGSADEVPAPTSIEVGDKVSSDHVRVVITSSTGTSELDVVKVNGRWKIDLPSYAAAP